MRLDKCLILSVVEADRDEQKGKILQDMDDGKVIATCLNYHRQNPQNHLRRFCRLLHEALPVGAVASTTA
jgi:hypothetical protein